MCNGINEDRAEFESTLETARVILSKEWAPNHNFLPIAVKDNSKNTNYQDGYTTRHVSATPPATLLGGWAL